MERSKVVKALATVIDPNTGKDILSVHMVERLEVTEDSVSFHLILPNLNSDFKFQLNAACQEAIQAVYPKAKVHVHMVSQQGGANTNSGAQPDTPMTQVKNIIAVASGKGGVGKSTVSVNLALALKELGASVGLVDADLYGPSIPTMLGLQGQRPKVKEIYGQPKIEPLYAFDIPLMSIGFIIEPEQAVVLRGPRLAGIIKQFFNDVLWPPLDFLIVDLPPGTGDVQLSLVQTVPVTGAVMVTTPQEVALADAVKAMNMFALPNVNVPVLGVVENMSWFTPAELPDNKYHIFGEGGGKKLALQSKSVLLGQLPLVQRIRESGDNGEPAVVAKDHPGKPFFLEIAKRTLQQVAIRHEYLEPTKIVEVKG